MNTHVVARILIKVWCTSLRLTMYSFGFYSILILCDFFFYEGSYGYAYSRLQPLPLLDSRKSGNLLYPLLHNVCCF